MCDEEKECDCKCADEPDWFKLLDHSRSLFVYHAGQRLNSIRYFFAIYGIIFGGYISVLSSGETGMKEHFSLAAITLLGAFVASTFHSLDLRNEELVHVDENAMDLAERKILPKLNKTKPCTDDKDKPCTNREDEACMKNDFPNKHLMTSKNQFDAFRISYQMHNAPNSKNGNSYGTVMNTVFGLAFHIPLYATIVHAALAVNLALKPPENDRCIWSIVCL